MRTREELRPYQRAGIRFIKEKKRCALFVDPGLGKTTTTLTSLCDMIDELECGRVLVVAPPQVAKKTWHKEMAEWAHLRNKSYVRVRGTPAQRRKLLAQPACFHIISMELLPWLLVELGGGVPRYRKVIGGKIEQPSPGVYVVDGKTLESGDVVKSPDGNLYRVKGEKLGKAKEEVAMRYEPGDTIKEDGSAWRPPHHLPYDAIVVDESSKVKSQATNRWHALKQMAFMVEYFVELTGTPAANSYEDLWAQIYLIDGGQRLGGTITAFRQRWCQEKFNGGGYMVKGWAAKIIEKRIADIVFTLREADYSNLPPRMYNRIPLTLEDATMKEYKKFERTYILKLSEDKKLIARDGAAITTKLLQLANGIVYNTEGPDDDKQKVEYAFHRVKLDALHDLVDEYQGQPLLVAYAFRSDVSRIQKEMPFARLFDDSEETQDAWNRGEIPMLLVHPKAAAHGLNLQFGGNNVVWYGPTYSLEDYIQLNKRLHRSGQKKPVMVHHLIAEGTIDEDVMKALDGKDDMQEALLNALKKRVEMYVQQS
jgi:SNF2 family DNA or RNA helicase